MLVQKENIQKIIPQRPPFVMVDSLLEASDAGFRSDFIIEEENLFSQNGVFMEPGLIENIAQTCAAGFGYLQQSSNDEPKIGFIGAINKLFVHAHPPIHAKIQTQIDVIHQMENVFLVKGENFYNDLKLLECELKIVIV